MKKTSALEYLEAKYFKDPISRRELDKERRRMLKKDIKQFDGKMVKVVLTKGRGYLIGELGIQCWPALELTTTKSEKKKQDGWLITFKNVQSIKLINRKLQ